MPHYSPHSPIFNKRITYGQVKTGTMIGEPLAPTVTITPQINPTDISPVVFDVVFSEAVTGFVIGDVTMSGTAGATSKVLGGSGPAYTVTVSGMPNQGTITLDIAASIATSVATGKPNQAGSGTADYLCTDNPFVDDFNRPDTTAAIDALGACWEQLQLGGNFLWRINTNRMIYNGSPSSFVTSRWAEAMHPEPGPDLAVEWDAVSMPGTFLSYQCQIRATADLTIGAGTSSYLLDISHSGFGSPNLVLTIQSIVAGVATTLQTVTLNNQGSGGASPLMPIRMRFSAIGTAIKLDTLPVGGGSVTNRLSVTNSAVTTGSHVAYRALSSSNSNTVAIDNVSIT